MDNQEMLDMLDAQVSVLSHEPPEPTEPPPTPESIIRGETTARIVTACGLADSLALSACLSCANSVLAQDSRNRATLYCKMLFRDLEVSIVDCTAFSKS